MFINIISTNMTSLLESIVRTQAVINNLNTTPSGRMDIGDCITWGLRQYFTNTIPDDCLSCVESDSLPYDIEYRKSQGVIEGISVKTLGKNMFDSEGCTTGLSIKNTYTSKKVSKTKKIDNFIASPGFDYLMAIQRGKDCPVAIGILKIETLLSHPGITLGCTGDHITADVLSTAWDFFYRGQEKVRIGYRNSSVTERKTKSKIAKRDYIKTLFDIGEIELDLERGLH